MTDLRFARAAALVQSLGRVDAGPPGELRAALQVGLPFSLWDVVATTLLMYRFPLLFSPQDGAAVAPTRAMALRPYRGLLARAQDRLVRPPRTPRGIARWPSTRRAVLFPAFVESFYRDVLRPVADSMTDAETSAVVLREGPAPADAGRTAEADHSIWEHWDRAAASRERDLKRRLNGVRRALFARERLAAARDALRPEFGAVAIDHDLRWLFWRELPRLLPRVAIAMGLFERHVPALVVSADDADPRCRIYALLARASGTPTLLVQQGLLRRDIPEFLFLVHDRVAAMGPASVADMVAQDVSEDRIIVTGQPGFDEMARATDEARYLRTELAVPPGSSVTLFASQPPVPGAFRDLAARRAMIAALAQSATSAPDRVLVIKPHPGESVADLRALAGSRPNVVVVDRRRSIAPLIRACDVFVTFFSTSALQALYAGKPVMNLDFSSDEGVRMYADSKATWVAQSAGELASHLDALLGRDAEGTRRARDAARARFLAAFVHHTDGQAADRVAEAGRALVADREVGTCA